MSQNNVDPSPERQERRDRLRSLAEIGRRQTFRRGAILITEGDLGDSLYVVISGRVVAYAADDSGRRVDFGEYGQDDLVGEMSLDGGPRTASVEALERTVCSIVSRSQLLEYIARQPEFALDLMERVIGRARVATRNMRDLALLDTYGRLARLLAAGSAEAGGANERSDEAGAVVVRMTHRQIASRIGSSRAMVSRLLSDLEKGGYIHCRKGEVRLVKALPSGW